MTHYSYTGIGPRRHRGLSFSLPIMDRTVSEAPRPQREIIGALGQFVAAVVSIRRNEGSLFSIGRNLLCVLNPK
jgi:hypothetical protein